MSPIGPGVFHGDVPSLKRDPTAKSTPRKDLSYQIGISSGPVVAGVIGTQNYTYDLWGDAANTASRMYSCGMKGKIQTTKSTVDLLKNEFNFISRGKLNVKGKGMMECFLFDGKKVKGLSDAPMIGSRLQVKAKVNQRQIRRAFSQWACRWYGHCTINRFYLTGLAYSFISSARISSLYCP